MDLVWVLAPRWVDPPDAAVWVVARVAGSVDRGMRSGAVAKEAAAGGGLAAAAAAATAAAAAEYIAAMNRCVALSLFCWW